MSTITPTFDAAVTVPKICEESRRENTFRGLLTETLFFAQPPARHGSGMQGGRAFQHNDPSTLVVKGGGWVNMTKATRRMYR